MKKKIAMKKLLPQLGGILIGAFIGFTFVYILAKQDLNFIEMMLSIVFLCFAFILHIIIHEAGHLVFGLLTGYEFLSFRIFSFCVTRTEGRYSWVKIKAPGLLGQCLMIPPVKKENFKYQLYLLGGVLANIILSLISLIFIPINVTVVAIFAITGLFLAVMNIIPNTFNDGATLKLASSSKENEKLLYIQLDSNAKTVAGATYKELPKWYFEKINTRASYLTDYQYFLKLALHYENLNFTQAKELLESLWQEKEKLILPYQMEMKKELLFCLLLLEPEDIRIKELVRDKKLRANLNIQDISNQRILASIAFVNDKNITKTKSLINSGINWNNNVANIGATKVEKKLLAYLYETWQLKI